MKPINYEECTTKVAEGQEEYQTLPCYYEKHSTQGVMVVCWKLTRWERVKLLFTGKVWHSITTFNKPLQPIFLSTTKEEHLISIDHKPRASRGFRIKLPRLKKKELDNKKI